MTALLMVDLGAVWGGQEIYSQSVSQNMLQRGWKMTCVSPHDRHAIPGIEFHRCAIDYGEFPATRRLVRDLADRHDIVHFNGIRAIYLSAVATKNRAFVGTKHSPHTPFGPPSLRARTAQWAGHVAFRNLDWLIGISSRILDELPKGIRQRSSVVLNGVADLGVGHEVLFDGGPLKICFVGRFIEDKGPMQLLQAFQILRERGVQFEAVLAGQGPLEQTARQFVHAQGLASSVTFAGFVDKPGRIYRASHVCILPSVHEGLPLCLLEAMSARCALVGHEIPGVRDVLRHEQNGLFAGVPAPALADTLCRLHEDRGLLARLRATARADYENRWRVDRMVDDTEAIYRKLLSGSTQETTT